MLFRLFKVFCIIFLIAFTMPVNAVFANESPNDVIGDVLDIPYETALDNALDNATNSTDDTDPLTAYILKKNPGISTGEMMQVYVMIKKQVHEKDLHFILCYINNSDEYVVPGLQLTAREIVKENPRGDYATMLKSFDRIVEAYGHMTRNEKVEFLKTEDPGTESLISFFSQMSESNDVSKLAYILNSSKDAFDDYKNKVDKIGSGNVLKAGDIIEKANKALSNRLMTLSISYDMDSDDNLIDFADYYGMTFNRSDWQHLQRDQIEDTYMKLTVARDSVNGVFIGVTAVAVIIGLVAGTLQTLAFGVLGSAISFFGNPVTIYIGVMLLIAFVLIIAISAAIDQLASTIGRFVTGPLTETKTKIELLCTAMKRYLYGDDFLLD